MTSNSYDWGFACYEMIFRGRYLKIRLVIEPLVLINAFMKERVRIMRAKRVKIMEVLDSYYVYFPKQ